MLFDNSDEKRGQILTKLSLAQVLYALGKTPEAEELYAAGVEQAKGETVKKEKNAQYFIEEITSLNNDIPDEEEDHYTVKFDSGLNGSLTGTTVYENILTGLTLEDAGVVSPTVVPNKDYKFEKFSPSFNLKDKVTSEYKKINLVYNKFLLERYLHKYRFNKSIIIKDIKNFHRNRRHILKKNHNYYLEREILEKFYKKNFNNL